MVLLLLLLGLLLVWVHSWLLLGKSCRGGASRRVMYYGPSGRTRRVMVRKMGIVLVLLLQLLSSLELLLLLLLHVRRMVMRTGRLLLAVVAVHLHVMVKTGCGVGMVLFLEILLLLLVLVDVLRLRLVVAVFGRHLLHVTLGDLGSLLLLLLLLIRRRMLSVWRDNVIRLLVGAVVAD